MKAGSRPELACGQQFVNLRIVVIVGRNQYTRKVCKKPNFSISSMIQLISYCKFPLGRFYLVIYHLSLSCHLSWHWG